MPTYPIIESMETRNKAALVSLFAIVIAGCSKSAGPAGSYSGVGHLPAYQQQYMSSLPPEVQKHAAEGAAAMRGQLILNADGSATESNNYKGGHNWTGYWTRNADKIQVTMAGGPSDTFTASPDGKTLTSSKWTFTKQ